jgi:hypothetical protein
VLVVQRLFTPKRTKLHEKYDYPKSRITLGSMAEPLHIASSIKIVAKHRNTQSISVSTARDEIKRLATNAANEDTVEDVQLREHLERSTGLSIKALARLTDRWPN